MIRGLGGSDGALRCAETHAHTRKGKKTKQNAPGLTTTFLLEPPVAIMTTVVKTATTIATITSFPVKVLKSSNGMAVVRFGWVGVPVCSARVVGNVWSGRSGQSIAEQLGRLAGLAGCTGLGGSVEWGV